MIEPVQDILKPRAGGACWHLWPVNHHHRQAKRPCRVELGSCAGTPGILGNNDVDPVIAHQGLIRGHLERPTRNHDAYVDKRQLALGRINQPHQVMMLRLVGEEIQVLLANGQEHTHGVVWQGSRRRGQIGNVPPVVIGSGLPRWSFKGRKRHTNLRAGAHGIRGHLRGKGMRGVDHRLDLLGAEIGRQPVNTAKPADPHGQGLRHGRCCTPGIGEDRVITTLGQGPRQARRFAGAAQNKDAWHG